MLGFRARERNADNWAFRDSVTVFQMLDDLLDGKANDHLTSFANIHVRAALGLADEGPVITAHQRFFLSLSVPVFLTFFSFSLSLSLPLRLCYCCLFVGFFLTFIVC